MKSAANHACQEDAAIGAAALACPPNLVLQHALRKAWCARAWYHAQPAQSDHDIVHPRT